MDCMRLVVTAGVEVDGVMAAGEAERGWSINIDEDCLTVVAGTTTDRRFSGDLGAAEKDSCVCFSGFEWDRLEPEPAPD